MSDNLNIHNPNPETTAVPNLQTGPPELTPDQAWAVLGPRVSYHVAQGWEVMMTQPYSAILTRKKRIGWFWNLTFTVLTGGLWLIVVIVKIVNRKQQSLTLTVRPDGRIEQRNN